MNVDAASDWFRLVTVIICWASVAKMAALIYDYCKVAIPLRKRVGEHKVLTPPIYWTLAYHVGITALLILFALASINALVYRNQVTWITFVAPFAIGGFTAITTGFHSYYKRVLRGARPDAYQPPRSDS